MRVLLLCAGYATRLYPLTENQPKSLLPIGGRPMLEHILERVEKIKQEIKSATVISNHKFAGHFERWAKSLHYPWPVEVVNDQTTTNENRLGAIGDLNYALKEKNIAKEDLLVIAGDNLFDFDLNLFVRSAKEHSPHAVLAVSDVGSYELAKQYGLVKRGKENQVLDFLEKPQNPPTTLASCGLYWLPGETRVLLDRYMRESHNADQPGHYMRWLMQNDGLFAIPLEGYWYDIGDLASYQKANAQFVANS